MASFFTYYDAIQHLTDFAGRDGGARTTRFAKRAIASAYRKIFTQHDWTYAVKRGRIVTRGPYSTGTVVYDHTGGTHERQLTLSDGTWPSWAARGSIVISNTIYRVERRISDTVITLDGPSPRGNDLNPGADIAAGTSYRLYQDTYPMPDDWSSSGSIEELSNNIWTSLPVSPQEWLQAFRAGNDSTSIPVMHTYMQDPDEPSRMAVSFFWPPDDAYNLDFIYQSRGVPLRTDTYSTGSITSSGVTVTGSGTTWTSRHVGAVLWSGVDNTNVPDGLEGTNPYHEARIIERVNSATELEVNEAFTTDISSAVKYRVSDLLDIQPGVMYTVFLRLCELEFAEHLPRDDVLLRRELWRAAMVDAKEADRPTFGHGAVSFPAGKIAYRPQVSG